jgi:pimeloyl-ACP methyl ester carboxylesterase
VSLQARLQDGAVTPVRHAVYLHGFASSPESSKAVWLGEALRREGVGYSCPDLNMPSFETLTVTRMVEQTLAAVDAVEGPVALIGSSLGAYVAVHAAAADAGRRVDRLVLLAPALDFGGNRLTHLGPHSIEEWRRAGALTVNHYGLGGTREVGFALYEDAARYDAFDVRLKVPTLVVQGRQDDLVDPAMVERWCAARPSVDLHLVDDGHQLRESLPFIWGECQRLFGL